MLVTEGQGEGLQYAVDDFENYLVKAARCSRMSIFLGPKSLGFEIWFIHIYTI